MNITIQPFWTPKKGNTLDQYEDAFRPASYCGPLKTAVRCAVADGATETAFAALWAKRLVWGYGRGWLDNPETLSRRLPTLQKIWQRSIGKMQLSWHAEEKFRQGAYAALAGLTFYPADAIEFKWTAIAIGDSCLFQLRDDNLITVFPLTNSEQFNSNPALLGSNSIVDVGGFKKIMYMEGTGQEQDIFYLMTDAMACWFLKSQENGENPRAVIENINHRQQLDFQNWISRLRETDAIRNDDVTLLRITAD